MVTQSINTMQILVEKKLRDEWYALHLKIEDLRSRLLSEVSMEDSSPCPIFNIRYLNLSPLTDEEEKPTKATKESKKIETSNPTSEGTNRDV